MRHAEAECVVRTKGWLAGEPKEFQDALLKQAELKHLEPHQFVFHAGDEPGGIYGIVSGAFAIYLPLPIVGEQLAQFVGPGVWFGQGPMNLRQSRKMTFRSVQEARVFHVPLVVINEMVARHPAYLRSFGALTEMNLDLAALAVRDLLIPQVHQRIAATLIRTTKWTIGIQTDGAPDFHLTQSELGEMANASRALVNKALGFFEGQGWVSRGYGRITIRNWDALANFAHGGQDSHVDLKSAGRTLPETS